jgi:hypothetical protein
VKFVTVKKRPQLTEFDEIDFEMERLVGRDYVAEAVFAVGEAVGDDELVFGAGGHELHAFCPAANDSAEGECGGLAASVGTVEFLAGFEASGVVDGDDVFGAGLGAFAFAEGAVLEAGFCGGVGEVGVGEWHG